MYFENFKAPLRQLETAWACTKWIENHLSLEGHKLPTRMKEITSGIHPTFSI